MKEMIDWIASRQADHSPIKVLCKKCNKEIIWTSMYGDTCKECSEKKEKK